MRVHDLNGQKLEILETQDSDRRYFRSAHSSQARQALGERATDARALTVDQIDDGPGTSRRPPRLELVLSAIEPALPLPEDVVG